MEACKVTVHAGTGTIFLNQEGEILLGLRQGSHGAGFWSLPGGSWDFGESAEFSAAREVLEEINLTVTHMKKVPMWTDDPFLDDGKHFVTLYFIAKEWTGELLLREPDKCVEWRWFSLQALPAPLFAGIKTVLERGILGDWNYA